MRVPPIRCTPAQLRDHTDAELQVYIDEYYKRTQIMREQRDQIVRLRRELDSARNHVPLLGTVFNGTVL